MTAYIVFRRNTTSFVLNGSVFFRANVWTNLGYSSKTFNTPGEASTWKPQ